MAINPGLASMTDGGGNDNSYVDPSGNVVAFDPAMAAALAQPFANDKKAAADKAAAAKAVADKAAADKAAAEKDAADKAAAKKAAADALAKKTGIKLSTDLSDFTPTVQDIFIANAKSLGMTAQQYLESRGGASPVSGVYGDALATDPTGYPTDAAYSAALASGGLAAVRDVWNAARAGSPVLQASGAAPKLDANGKPINPTPTVTPAVTPVVTPAGTTTTPAVTPATSTPLTTPTSIDPKVQAQIDSLNKQLTDAQKAIADAQRAGGDNTATIVAAQKQATDAANAMAAATQATAAQQQAVVQGQQQNAVAFLTSTFTDLGLSADIAAAVTRLVQQGYTSDTIQLIAQDPKSQDPLAVAFQTRFPANAARLAAGLPVLSPADYISTERSYAQVLQSYGLPSDFASNKDVFTKLLTNDVSPTELNSRANTAKQVIDNTDPLVTQQLQQYYGLSQGDMIAHVLDPAVATPIIQKQITASQIGAESARAGANINQAYAEQLGGLGISQAQANTGFQNIAQSQQGMQELATRYNAYGPAGQIGQQLQAATFGTTGAAAATEELNRLKQQEVGQFSGSSGAGKGSLMGTEAGQN